MRGPITAWMAAFLLVFSACAENARAGEHSAALGVSVTVVPSARVEVSAQSVVVVTQESGAHSIRFDGPVAPMPGGPQVERWLEDGVLRVCIDF